VAGWAERILVCVRPNPESGRLVRAARRMAARLKAEWVVAYVESTAQPPLSAAEKLALAATIKLAEELGAQTATLSGESVAEALLSYARRHNVSRIVVGKPVHSRWRDRLRGSLLDEIVRGSEGIEVHVIAAERLRSEGQQAAGPGREPSASRPLPYVWSLGVVLLCSGVCWTMAGRFDKSNLIMVYLLGVAAVATWHGRGPSALAALLSVAAFDFFFVPPQLTFAVSDTQYVVTFGVMLVVSLLVSTLAIRVRAQADAARQREQRTEVLYAMSRELARARTAAEVASVASRHISELFRGPVSVKLPGPDGRLGGLHATEAAEARESAVSNWAFEHGRMAGLGTDTLPGASAIHVPLAGTQATLGVLCVRPDASLLPLSPEQLDMLDTLARQAASGLERAQLAEEAERARLAAEAERLRNTLLSSVSHDLRTPLATITGAASTLLQSDSLTDGAQRDLKQAIYEESERLNRLVTNLLDMTRLESGSLRLSRDWHSMEELVGTALSRLERGLGGRRVTVSVPADLPLVPVDGVLVEQVLVNLIDNAVKYTPAGSPLAIGARAEGAAIQVEVVDAGPGLPPGAEERVFEKFYRAGASHQGFGLGLPICKAIVTAHGGRIWAENRAAGGAAFHFTLPLGDGPPPTVEQDPDGEHD